jgi:hypothetical protein
MGSVQAITLGEAARRVGTTVDALLELIYRGQLHATPDPATGRLLVSPQDLADVPSTRVG